MYQVGDQCSGDTAPSGKRIDSNTFTSEHNSQTEAEAPFEQGLTHVETGLNEHAEELESFSCKPWLAPVALKIHGTLPGKKFIDGITNCVAMPFKYNGPLVTGQS